MRPGAFLLVVLRASCSTHARPRSGGAKLTIINSKQNTSRASRFKGSGCTVAAAAPWPRKLPDPRQVTSGSDAHLVLTGNFLPFLWRRPRLLRRRKVTLFLPLLALHGDSARFTGAPQCTSLLIINVNFALPGWPLTHVIKFCMSFSQLAAKRLIGAIVSSAGVHTYAGERMYKNTGGVYSCCAAIERLCSPRGVCMCTPLCDLNCSGNKSRIKRCNPFCLPLLRTVVREKDESTIVREWTAVRCAS